MLLRVSFSDPRLVDFSQLDTQGLRYQSVSFADGEDPRLVHPLLRLGNPVGDYLEIPGDEAGTT